MESGLEFNRVFTFLVISVLLEHFDLGKHRLKILKRRYNTNYAVVQIKKVSRSLLLASHFLCFPLILNVYFLKYIKNN